MLDSVIRSCVDDVDQGCIPVPSRLRLFGRREVCRGQIRGEMKLQRHVRVILIVVAMRVCLKGSECSEWDRGPERKPSQSSAFRAA